MKLFATSAFGAVMLNLQGSGDSSPFAAATPLLDNQQQLAQLDTSLWLGLGGDGSDENSLAQSEKVADIDDEAPLELSDISAENIDDLDEKGKAKAAKEAW